MSSSSSASTSTSIIIIIMMMIIIIIIMIMSGNILTQHLREHTTLPEVSVPYATLCVSNLHLDAVGTFYSARAPGPFHTQLWAQELCNREP